MKAVIVDDEPQAIRLLEQYVAHFEELECVATFRNGLKAFEYLNNHTVDLVFLDINMPHISGLSLAKIIPTNTKIIFTTAYSEYAVESYDVQAADYLLKPIGLERFAKAVQKVLVQPMSTVLPAEAAVLQIRSGKDLHFIKPSEVLYLEKDGNQMVYVCADKNVVARESIAAALQRLPKHFIQVHKSYVINAKKLDRIQGDVLIISQTQVPIGNTYKEELNRYLGL